MSANERTDRIAVIMVSVSGNSETVGVVGGAGVAVGVLVETFVVDEVGLGVDAVGVGVITGASVGVGVGVAVGVAVGIGDGDGVGDASR